MKKILSKIKSKFKNINLQKIKNDLIFWHYYQFQRGSQNWSYERLRDYQLFKLKKLIDHSCRNVPYYQKLFKKLKLNPEDFNSLLDLEKIPFLTKNDIRKNPSDLIAKDVSKNDLNHATTGGSTGTPLEFYLPKTNGPITKAFEWRHWNWMGYNIGDKSMVLRGHTLESKKRNPKVWWEYDKTKNNLILSPYDMNERNLPKFIAKIEEFKPKFIRAYASNLEVIGRFARERNIKINQEKYLKGISTTSETVYSHQKKLIEEIFSCPIYDKYGNSEQTNILGMCEKREGYHDFMEYGITEIVDHNGRLIIKEGQEGEMVVTGLHNLAMPLIRYKPEDRAVFTHEKCSCGRKLPLIKKIGGRVQELIVGKDGRLISMTGFLFAAHGKFFGSVKKLQFVQEKKGSALLKVVKNKDAKVGAAEIKKELEESTGNQINLKVIFVEDIPRTKRGKYKYLIQKLSINYANGKK